MIEVISRPTNAGGRNVVALKSLGRGIRRDPGLPEELAYGQACYTWRDYRHRLTLDPASPYEFRYRRSLRRALLHGVSQRELFCWIAWREDRVGALHLCQTDAPPMTENDEFFAAMDDHSLATATLGEVLMTSWPDGVYEVFDYGPVIEFHLAWVAPQYSARVPWAAAAEALIEREFADYSVLLMKAFPLEYSEKGKGHTRRLAHRQAAMRRYYQRLFGVVPLPGGWGRDGWWWRRHPRLKRAVPQPMAVRLTREAGGRSDPTS